MNPKRCWLLLSVLTLGLLWAFPGTIQAQNHKDYLLGAEDVIDITVWGHDDLKRVIPVSLEGIITFPLIGEVRAAGKSAQELEREMAARLGDGYLVKPQITISVKEYNSQKVFVMGEVNKPGTYPVTKENNLVYFLSQAGGATKEAGEEVLIIRPEKPHSRGMTLEEAAAKKVPIITLSLKDALAGDSRHNVPIRNGDSIMVSKIPFFFVLGEVKNPGKYSLERGTNVLTGISMGGGLKDEAGEEVAIIRPGNPHSGSMTLEEAEAKKVPIIKFSLRDALAGDPKHNIPIRGGDSIIVSKIPFFFVLGEVKNPGKYNLSRGTNVMTAVSLAGGLKDEAGEEVGIIRTGNPVLEIMTLEEAEAKKVPIIKLNIRDALAGVPKHNIPIQGGDSIIVSKIPFFFVMGEVRNPGKYNLERGTTVLRAISMGGGLRDAGEEVVIIRPNSAQTTIMTVEEAEAKKVPIIVLKLRDVLDDDPKHNLLIHGGDSINVSKIPFFFVMGEVKSPGKYNLERGTTVLRAMSMAGGLTPKAAPGRTRVVREKDGKRVELRVTMETLVLPGDTLIIPESFF